MQIKKRTKIALIMLFVSIVLFSVVILVFVKPIEEEPDDISQGDPKITTAPTPTPTPIPKDNNEEIAPPEPEGLTNNQKYYKTLVEPGSRNILLIGQDAVYHAYDSIIVLNIDDKNKTMKLINFPRDTYIDYNDKILKAFKEADPDNAADPSIQKLNAAHAIAISLSYGAEDGKFGQKGSTAYSMNFWAELLDEIFGIPIDDYLIIQTRGFREIINFFDGVYIDVPIYMNYEDPVQDLYIHLDPGHQLLNGEQAEGFVRFRQGYTPEGEFKTYSVYFRQKNQNEFLKAFFEQHVTLNNLARVGDFVDVISKNVKTSVKGTEVFKYANVMQKIVRGKYEGTAEIIECPTNKNIKGIIYEILKVEQE